MTNEEFLEKVRTKFGDSIEVLTEYKSTKEEILVKDIAHPEKGIIRITPNHLLTRGLPKYNRIKNTDELKERIALLVGDEYTVLGEYKTGKEKTTFQHNCGYIFEMRPEDFLAGQRCPKCANKRRAESKRKKYDDVETEISEMKDYKLISKDYNNNKELLKVQHTCGHIWEVSLVNLRRHGCPKCALKSTSKKEKELLEYIKSIYTGAIEENVKFTINGNDFEADIVLSDLKIVIEFNGIYWHSTKIIKDPKYHINKTNAFYSLGYRTIHVFEDEWENKKDIVKQKLLHILGKDNINKIYGRKTICKEVDTNDAKNFLEKYHLQGYTPSKYRLGLYFDNELVAVMTFGNGRFSKKEKTVELIRYATSKNVIGGFSKLLKEAIKKYNFSEVVTYADLRWSSMDKNVYSTNGFNLDHTSQVGYAYYDPYTFEKYNRYGFRKSELKKKFPNLYEDALTEEEIMNKTKYLRVYDCGNLVYTYEK